ncbi:MAG: Na+/H+ antiporter NhaC family protein [Peptostreptococcaceae bacterium]|nr:Na+/H+ antiporter NhaC family protein [Peptostreptococcaceae bacterium]
MLFNAVVISVIVMCVLCLFKFNILLSIIVSAIVGGVVAGMPIYSPGAENNIISVFISGMGGNSSMALSYILLGAFAVALADSGLGTILSRKISQVLSGKKFFLIFAIAFIACFSQNIVPVHIAFIPILIPPLLSLMNRLMIDRRAVACALTFGLKAPYIVIPLGFGLQFHQTIQTNVANSGLDVSLKQIVSVMWIAGLSMLIGLVFCVFVLYGKNRQYKDLAIKGTHEEQAEPKMTRAAWGALLACLITAIVSAYTESLAYGALSGIFTMILTGCIRWKNMDEVINGGIAMMGYIAFIMLAASGYGKVLKESGAVDELVKNAAVYMQASKAMAATIMLLVGLLITMGIGTSFGTIPIIAAIYVPLCTTLGFSPESTILLIGVAAALGDAGSPASDSTLGPTSGLDADGQHEHIWDTCVPTFIAFDIPLIIGGVIGAVLLG